MPAREKGALRFSVLTSWQVLPQACAGRPARALLIVAAYSSVNGVVKAELSPTEVRALGASLPYSLANALFGGTAGICRPVVQVQGSRDLVLHRCHRGDRVALMVHVFMRDTRKHSRIAED